MALAPVICVSRVAFRLKYLGTFLRCCAAEHRKFNIKLLQPCRLKRRLPNYFLMSFITFDLFKSSAPQPEEEIVEESPEEARRKQMEPLIKKTDKLYQELDFRKIYALLLPYKDDDDDEVLWRLGRAAFELAKLCRKQEERQKLNREALSYVERAVYINENNFAAHKWLAILLDVCSEYDGTKARIAHSLDVKYHIQKATHLNPQDGTSYYLLGMWCFSFADLPWYQRKMAAVLFATPPTSSYEEALEAFLLAERAEPKFYSMNLLMLGKTYLKLGELENAIRYLLQVKKYPLKTEDDKMAHKEAMDLLGSLGVH